MAILGLLPNSHRIGCPQRDIYECIEKNKMSQTLVTVLVLDMMLSDPVVSPVQSLPMAHLL